MSIISTEIPSALRKNLKTETIMSVLVTVPDAVAIRSDKLVYILLALFILLILFIKLCPAITLWDKALIVTIQELMKNIPIMLAELPDCKLYTMMIVLPLIIGIVFFFKRKQYLNIVFLCSIPLITFLLNCIIKPMVHRTRPPYGLQLSIHPESFSYVSSHSLVTICLYGIVIYFINKYCSNKPRKIFFITISVLWILLVGYSRIWLGVHYPSDVIGAYLLGSFLLFLYVKLFKKVSNNE